MFISRSIWVLFFLLSLFNVPQPLLHPSLNRERSSNHQSVCSSCGLRQHHAGLSVFPDGTSVPSGYLHTSILTPLIFTCYRANWKIHKSLKWPHRSQSLDFGNDCVFHQLVLLSVCDHCLFGFWGLVFYSRIISDAAKEKRFAGIHHQPSSNKNLGPIKIWVWSVK